MCISALPFALALPPPSSSHHGVLDCLELVTARVALNLCNPLGSSMLGLWGVAPHILIKYYSCRCVLILADAFNFLIISVY